MEESKGGAISLEAKLTENAEVFFAAAMEIADTTSEKSAPIKKNYQIDKTERFPDKMHGLQFNHQTHKNITFTIFKDGMIWCSPIPENLSIEEKISLLKKQHEFLLALCTTIQGTTPPPKLTFSADEKTFSPSQKKQLVETLESFNVKNVLSKSGIAAGSSFLSERKTTGYSLHAWMDKCRAEINAKLNPAGHSLPEKEYNLVSKDAHKLTIHDNGNMEANLKSLESMSEQEFADFICKDLKAYVNMFIAMHEKHKIAVFPENKINLFVIQKEINTPEGKAKIAKIEALVAKQMHAFLNDPQIPNDVKNKFTVLGRTLAQGPAPAPTPTPASQPKPSAPPLSTDDENTPPGSDPKKLNLSKAPDAAAPTAPTAPIPPASPKPPGTTR